MVNSDLEESDIFLVPNRRNILPSLASSRTSVHLPLLTTALGLSEGSPLHSPMAHFATDPYYWIVFFCWLL